MEFILALYIFISQLFFPGIHSLQTENGNIPVEIANTKAEQILGLSNRSFLKSGTGLLFVFQETGSHGIWMKDMKFPIDIVWLDKSLNIVDLKANVSPKTFPKVFSSKTPSSYVLEINAGEAREFKLHIGTKLEATKGYN